MTPPFPPPAGQPTPRRSVLPMVILSVLLAIAVVVGLGFGGLYVYDRMSAKSEDQNRAEVTRVSGDMVRAMTSLDYREPDRSLSTMRELSTGKMRSQIDVMGKTMEEIAESAKAVSTSTIKSVAIETLTDDSAQTVVVAETTQTATGRTTPTKSSITVQLALRRVDGKWLVDEAKLST